MTLNEIHKHLVERCYKGLSLIVQHIFKTDFYRNFWFLFKLQREMSLSMIKNVI